MGRGQAKKTAEDKEHILRFINVDLVDYLPVTVRQIHYKMVKALLIENTKGEYKRISRLMKELRLDGELEWWKVEDRSRRMVDAKKWLNLDEFYREKLKDFEYYFRCRVQQQQNYVEVWSEKDALASIFERATLPYCVKLVIVRGQVSATYINNYVERARTAILKGQRPVIIYGGDLDPTGWQIPRSIRKSLTVDHEIGDMVTIDRFALNRDHVTEYDLPVSFDAVKTGDPNTEKYVGEFGHLAVELDALDPPDLHSLLETSLHRHLDMESFDQEAEIEKQEQAKHHTIMRKFRDLIEHELRQ